MTAKNTDSSPHVFMIGIFAVTWASRVMAKMKSSDTNVPLRGFLRAASVTYVRSSTKPNM